MIRLVAEEIAALVSIALFSATILIWAVILTLNNVDNNRSQSQQRTTGVRSTEIVAKLRSTAAEREQSSARDEEKYLMIVAKLSRADAMLMQEAADEIDRLSVALRECAQESYLDEWDIEFYPTRGANIARAALGMATSSAGTNTSGDDPKTKEGLVP